MITPRPKILSIDDHQVLNFMRQKVLAVAGYDCDVASSADQGSSLAVTNHYDAVLLDYYLPGTTGVQVANTIRSVRPGLPIVLVTGEELHEHSPAVHSYLIKGDGPEALIARLKSVVAQKTMHAGAC
jgi:DNA-binding response OmpR family regulator